MADRPILFSAPMVRALLDGRKTQTRRLFKPRGFEFETHPVSGDRYNQYRPYRDGTWDESRIVGSGAMRAFRWGEELYSYLPYAPGDSLWVKETAAVRASGWHHVDGDWHQVDYAANFDGMQRNATPGIGLGIRQGKAPKHFPDRSHNADQSLRWHPSIFMPRWASRLTLTVTEVRVERLQDCNEEDAIAEGIEPARWDVANIDGWRVYTDQPPVELRVGDEILQLGRDRDKQIAIDPRFSYQTLWDSINGPGAWEANPWVVAVTFTVGRHNIDAGVV